MNFLALTSVVERENLEFLGVYYLAQSTKAQKQ